MTRLYLLYRPRVILVNTLVTGLLLAVISKLFCIQLLNHDIYRDKALRQSTEVENLPANRGTIEDRNGTALTSNAVHFSFAVDPQVLEEGESLVNLFARIFNRPAAYYRNLLTADRSFIWLERNVPRDQCQEILDLETRGLIVRQEVRRQYPYGHITAPLIGFTDIDGKGISGIELEYDSFLRGEDGWQELMYDAKGRILPPAGNDFQSPRHGGDLSLTIDIDYQSILQEEIARANEQLVSKSINGILMDPRTGEILAIAQHPSFNPSRPWESPAADQRLKAVSDMFEPGSTIKVVTATAAIDDGVYSPADTFFCENGQYVYYNLVVRDIYPREILSLSDIIAHSSNIGIIKVAEDLGPDLIYKYCYRFGLGTRTGIDLPGESPGILREPGDWSSVSTGVVAMGHEIGTTTLQLALIYSAVANGGLLMRPLLVTEVIDAGGEALVTNHPEVIRRVASPATMEQLRYMLYNVVEEGTGTEAQLPGYTIAGKTGTAQKFLDGEYSDREFVATFAAIFPADQPRLVCVVAVDSPQYGSHFGGGAAAPIVRNTIKRILNLDDDLEITPVLTPQVVQAAPVSEYSLASADLLPESATPGVVPDFRGFSLRKALQLARRTGVDVQMEGSGRVISQSLTPGSLIDQDDVCLITLAPESD